MTFSWSFIHGSRMVASIPNMSKLLGGERRQDGCREKIISTYTPFFRQEVTLSQNSSAKTPSYTSLATRGPRPRTELTSRDQWLSEDLDKL